MTGGIIFSFFDEDDGDDDDDDEDDDHDDADDELVPETGIGWNGRSRSGGAYVQELCFFFNC